MLSKIRFQHYKSLYDTEVDLEPLTVFIGPNGSGKSNICEALAVWSDFINNLIRSDNNNVIQLFLNSINNINQNSISIESKFWQQELNYLLFGVKESSTQTKGLLELIIRLDYHRREIAVGDKYNKYNKESLVGSENTIRKNFFPYKDLLLYINYQDSPVFRALKFIQIYDFAPQSLSAQSQEHLTVSMSRTGQGIAYSLVDILLANRQNFDELEQRLTKLIPNISRISLPRKGQNFELELIDISDGTLRILAFLVALYQEKTPSIICFEEIENGIHPWLLNKIMELLKIVSTEGINGKPVQILITTHSPLVLNYVEPHQVRAVELDDEGKTQVHVLPTDSVRFQKALEAYDGELGELWFTNVFGGNPV